MKNLLLISIIAVTAMLSIACSQDEVTTSAGGAISFGEPFVDNATRGVDFKVNNLDSFAVYGYYVYNGRTQLVFNNEKIYKDNTVSSGYSYKNIQFWNDGDYTFNAIAPYNGSWSFTNSSTTRKITFSNADANGDEDLILAGQCRTFSTLSTSTTSSDNVSLNFSHLLSRIQFKFINGFEGDNRVIITRLKISNVRAEDIYAYTFTNNELTNGVWLNSSADTTHFSYTASKYKKDAADTVATIKSNYGNKKYVYNSVTLDSIKYVIPQSAEFSIEIDGYREDKNGNKFFASDFSYNLKDENAYTISISDMAPGNSYLLTGTITGNKIEFVMTKVEKWDAGN
jgi:hypothetical protein